MKQKIEEKLKAIELRKQGLSYSEINKTIKVSRSTLSLWLRNIPLSERQIRELKGRDKSRHYGAQARIKKRINKTRKILSRGIKEAKELSSNNLFVSGLMLYWAEGTKFNESVKFSNSDPLMIKLIMKWFREICRVPENKFRVEVHIHTLHVKEDIEKYWSTITQVPLNQFHKTMVKPTTLKQRKNKLYEGTCSIRINDVDLYRKIMGWKTGLLQEFDIKFKYKIPGKT